MVWTRYRVLRIGYSGIALVDTLPFYKGCSVPYRVCMLARGGYTPLGNS
jgi:hypothetical protein